MVNRSSTPVVTIFIVTSVVQLFFSFLYFPLLQGPDELNHAHRIVSISNGHFFSQMTPINQPGGLSEIKLEEVYNNATSSNSSRIPWSASENLIAYPNTAINSPFGYLPSAVGVFIGRALFTDIETGLYLGRTINAFSYIAIGTVALLLSGSSAKYLVILLLMPMSAFLANNLTQDGVIIAASAFAVSLFVNASEIKTKRLVNFCAFTATMLLISVSKAPYIFLSIFIGMFPGIQLPLRLIAMTLIAFLSFVWFAYVIAFLPVIWPDGVGSAEQLHGMLSNIWSIFPIAINTFKLNGLDYLIQFTANLGQLDAPAPFWFAVYTLAMLFFSLVSISGSIGQANREHHIRACLAFFSLILSCAGIFGALYLTWSPVGLDHVQGVQGRYFIPVMMFVVLIPYQYKVNQEPQRLAGITIPAISYFSGASAVMFAMLLITRY